jgi:hypothetical protein
LADEVVQSWFSRPHVEVALKQAEDKMRAELIAYQRKQLCLKIAYEPALLDSLEATHAKLVELKNYHNLQDTYRGYHPQPLHMTQEQARTHAQPVTLCLTLAQCEADSSSRIWRS